VLTGSLVFQSAWHRFSNVSHLINVELVSFIFIFIFILLDSQINVELVSFIFIFIFLDPQELNPTRTLN